MSFISQIIADNIDRLYYVRGADSNGGQYWYFIFVQAGKASSFSEIKEGEDIDLAHYSSVIKCGHGAEAPDDVVQHMKSKFNCCF